MPGRALLAALALTPLAPASAQAPGDQLHAFLQSAYADARAEAPELTYSAASADLDGDGRDEALVMPHASAFCGSGGCALYIYTPEGTTWRQVDELTIVGENVRLLPTRTRGWRDLAVNVRGGGTDLPRQVRLRFDGRGYRAGATVRGNPGRALLTDATPDRTLFR